MKSSGLMLGDLVFAQTVTPEFRICRIKDINGCKDFVGVYDIKDEDEYLVGRYLKDIEPIPLTAEILNVNGFKCRQTYANPRYSYFDDNGRKLISFQRNKQGYEMQVGGNRVMLENVHQLQHALRLCGLDDIADNFKIN